MHEEIMHMSVGDLRKMVAGKRRLACPPVANLSKAGLLSELAAYDAAHKARIAAKQHGPVTMMESPAEAAKVEKVSAKAAAAEAKRIAKAKKAVAKEEANVAKAMAKAQKDLAKANNELDKAFMKEGKKYDKAEKAKVKAAAKAAGAAVPDMIQLVPSEPRKLTAAERRERVEANKARANAAAEAAKAPKGKVAAAVAAIESKAKRPLTAYQKFVKANKKPGMSMAQVAAMYQAQK
jgi:colicin import membrane protein